MKTLIVMAGLVLTVSGCGHKPDARDAMVAKLEARLSELEARQQGLGDTLTNLLGVVEQMNTESKRAITKLMALELKQRDNWEATQPFIAAMQSALTNPPPKQAAVPRTVLAQHQPLARPNQGATRDGVPIAVYNQIASDAVMEWPGDYRMQAYTIKNQTEAYRKLHP